MKFLRYGLHAIAVVLLTVLTQLGGMVYLLSLLAGKWFCRRLNITKYSAAAIAFTFLLLYSVICFVMVPPLAKLSGRVRLPVISTYMQPVTMLTVVCNRNYVIARLYEAITSVAEKMNEEHPGTRLNYLDACFPVAKFPLFPHLSHNDGRKLDLSFRYIDSRTSQKTNEVPSAIGYGVSEEPGAGEINTCAKCESNGYWQYGMLNRIVPQGNKAKFMLDVSGTKWLVDLLTEDPNVEKIFIEPHLKARLDLTSSKIRFHGCHAVRHDDHIHVQVY